MLIPRVIHNVRCPITQLVDDQLGRGSWDIPFNMN